MEAILFLIILVLIGAGVSKAIRGITGSGNSPLPGKAGLSLGRILVSFFAPGAAYKKAEGAQFLTGKKSKEVLNNRNIGLLIDGNSLRLSPEQSFGHCMVVAPTGAGKTTRYVTPNLLTLDDCSFVVTDPSGELYRQTAGSLHRRGYEILLIDPARPRNSLCYNPLARISDYTQIMEMASTLVRSSNPGGATGESAFWYEGAADLISVLIRCLGIAGDEYLNLGNLLYLLQNFGGDGRGLLGFLERYADDSALNQFQGIVMGNEKTVQSFVSTATNSLQMLNNPEIAALMSRNDFDFDQLRQGKTALFLSVPTERIHHYRFIMNLLYVDLFNAMARELPASIRSRGEKCLPVYALMDEFGNTSIPNFSTYATTIRKYEVSLSIILQNFSQLATAYGHNEALTIIEGGMNSRVFYPGLPYNTAQNVEQILGKEVTREIKWDGTVAKKEGNLLNADRIRTLPDNQAIFITGNKEAMLLETTQSFRNPRMKKMLDLPIPSLAGTGELPALKRVPL